MIPGGTPIWKGRGCSSEILNLTPKRDQSWVWPNVIHTPKRINIANQISFFFIISSLATLNETLTAKNNDILPRTP